MFSVTSSCSAHFKAKIMMPSTNPVWPSKIMWNGSSSEEGLRNSRHLYEWRSAFAVLGIALLTLVTDKASAIDLSKAVIQSLPGSPAIASRFLAEQIGKRTGISEIQILQTSELKPVAGIALELSSDSGLAAEGYSIQIRNIGGVSVLHVRGADPRGVLFGAGRLIRELSLRPGSIQVENNLAITSSPRYPIRGHQLGYRNTANTYDAWDVETYRTYIEDLALFGTNTIELIPLLEQGVRDSLLMKEDPWTMNVKVAEIVTDLGLDFWLWIPATEDLTLPNLAQEGLRKRRQLFESMKHIDAVFVPGGDDGSNDARVLIPWLEQLASELHQVHPEATLWVSHQTFAHEELEYFFNYLHEKQPTWLEGVVYGPWTEMSLEETRRRTPSRYKMRRYPDITHNVRCEYLVPNWDRAFAHTLGREAVCPRPLEMANTHNLYAPLADGFVTYSDGAHDDLNKIIWSARGWDPDAKPEQIVREYSKVFFGDDAAETGMRALIGLETNWQGPVEENAAILETLQLWRELEKSLLVDGRNWRWQMYAMRATYDAYVRARQISADRQEKNALTALANAAETGIPTALATARTALAGESDATAANLRHEVETFGSQLRESIGFQLSTEAPYLASNSERGAVLDYLDQPLNERTWLEARFRQIESEQNPTQQLTMIQEIVNWENPGPGGFYDDLGNIRSQPHLVRQKLQAADPGGVASPRIDFSQAMDNKSHKLSDQRLSWHDVVETLYGTPLRMHYADLDPTAQYRLRVTYSGRYNATMTLTADGAHEIHKALPQPRPVWPVEFSIPQTATADGLLDLEWNLVSGRGCQVGEVWLIRE